METTWVGVVRYKPKILFLVKGWFCFLFGLAEDADRVLSRMWVVKSDNLMLKRWHTTFNLDKEPLIFRHLWVIFPGFPLVFWNFEAFTTIGNAIGKFLHVDLKHLTGSDRRMGRILVEVDLNEGLPEQIEIAWRGTIFKQRLDYTGVPFRCLICKGTSHLRH